MFGNWSWLLLFAVILGVANSEAVRISKRHVVVIRAQTSLSPLIKTTPGSVVERFYHGIKFPEGHIGIKSFDVEVVDKEGNHVSLFQTYLHHWSLVRYYQHKNATNPSTNISFTQLKEPNFIIASNKGVCQKHALPQFFGTGADSRKTTSFLPHPYGIEVGNADEVPIGYEEKWCFNVHVIDTRHVEDRLGCIECRCDLYNVSKDAFGKSLEDDYKGGLRCCYDKMKCKLTSSYSYKEDWERSLFVRYRLKWVDWDEFVIPLQVYIFDVTDTWKLLTDDQLQEHNCLIEYDVGSCLAPNDDGCNATKETRQIVASNGYLIYGMAHLHIGGIGATLYGQDGRVLCNSFPTYGRGREVGNEDGYLVGMSSCYPKPGTVKINDKEIITFVSNYDPTQNHTGVMSFFHLMVAQKLPHPFLAIGQVDVMYSTQTT